MLDVKERQERERLRQVWEQKQVEMKQERVDVTYSYWDGSGHRKQVTMKKVIKQFDEVLSSHFLPFFLLPCFFFFPFLSSFSLSLSLSFSFSNFFPFCRPVLQGGHDRTVPQ
jgi:hypothetical protein